MNNSKNKEMTIREDIVLDAIVKLEYTLQDKEVSPKGDLIHGNLYGTILNDLLKSHLSNIDARGVNYVWSKYDKALSEARKSNLEHAQQLLSEAESNQSEYQHEAFLLALTEVSALPMKAYLHYKKLHFTLAEELLWQSIQNDVQLIQQGFYILEYHRIQQLHNLCRLYFKQGNLIKGSFFINEALKYMYYEHQPSIGSDWARDALKNAPVELRSAMMLQLTLETIGVFLHNVAQERELYYTAFKNLTLFDPQTTEEAMMLKWFELKEMYFNGNENEGFVQQTIDFLTETPSEFDILKLSLIVNLSDLLKQQTLYSNTLHQKVLAFSNQLKVADRHKQMCLTYISQGAFI